MYEQSSLEDALDAVEAAADPQWVKAATAFVQHLANLGGRFTTDDVWDLLEEAGVTTDEPRAMGAIIRKFANAGVIVGAGEYWKSRRPECHQRPVKVWRGR